MGPRKNRRKTMNSLLDLRTSLGSYVRSMPSSRGQELIDAYMIVKKAELLENQLLALNKRKRRAEQTLQRMARRWGDTKLKDLVEEGLAGSNGAAPDTKPRAGERAPNSRKRLFATVKLRY